MQGCGLPSFGITKRQALERIKFPILKTLLKYVLDNDNI